MSDNILEVLQQKMLEAEEDLFDSLPDQPLDDLIELFHDAQKNVLDTAKTTEGILKQNRRFGQEALFSTFRVLKAILAEIESRIKENKI